jgi:hypothetical protein
VQQPARIVPPGVYACEGGGVTAAIPGDTCAAEGCDRPRQRKGSGHRRYCSGHQKRWETRGDVLADIPLGELIRAMHPKREHCDAPGCERPPSPGRLLCGAHLWRIMNHGEFFLDVPPHGAHGRGGLLAARERGKK